MKIIPIYHLNICRNSADFLHKYVTVAEKGFAFLRNLQVLNNFRYLLLTNT